MNSLVVIDSNIISLFILLVVFVASITINLSEVSKKTYFYYLILVTTLMLLIQSAIRLVGANLGADTSADKVLNFVYIALVPVLPALWALYITSQKVPRLIRDKIMVLLFFMPAAMNLILLSLGVYGHIYTMIFSIIPLVYTLGVVAKFSYSDSNAINIAYIVYVTVAAFASIFDSISLAGASVSILVLFISVEMSAAKLDSLTKINGRRHLYSYLERLVKAKKQFTLIMLDMDKLKHINDTYGHVEGDEAIRNVTEIINSQIRRNDFFARYAGDEFMVVVETRDKYIIKSLLNRIENSFEEYNSESSKKYTLSISAGYYINEDLCENVEELINKADEAMFKNKKQKVVSNWQKNMQLISAYK